MKKPFVALLLLIGAAAMLATSAFAQVEDLGIKLVNAKMAKQLLSSRAARLSVSAGPDPDTVYVGKSQFDHHNLVDNYWNIYTGSYLPGVPGGVASGQPAPSGGHFSDVAMWDWDNSAGLVAADSLQGWWPEHRQYNSAGGLTLTDDNRPWWCLDHGNVLNYVISQQPAAQRTFGVVGLWHSDPGGPANAVAWTPLSGTKSAWCGLREHGDLTVKDAVTKQAFNQDAVWGLHDGVAGTTVGSASGSANRFPGYVDQMDQMLYRDIAILPSQALTVTFKFRTRMSTSIVTTASTRSGWFHGDPLAVVAGNFISSSAALTNAPQDSFMVYAGAPVNEAACVYSDGVTRAVYDKQRRWFSEVIKTFGAGANYFEIFKAAGNNPTDTLDATPAPTSVTVTQPQISSILGGVAGNVRLVFRCKTNRGFADSDSRNSGYTSFGRGAVILDDVSYHKDAGPETGPAGFGDFEAADQSGPGSIDNRFDPIGLPTVTPINNWRSTGKPPGTYMHIEPITNLTFNDLCGPAYPIPSPTRVCNIGGQVLTCGNHDDAEAAGDDRFGASFREISQFAVSPTINLLESAPGVPNSMGITGSIANASDDYILWYDLYAGMFNLTFSGESWVFGAQCYPAMQANGAKCWGQPRFPGFIVFNPEPQCFTDFEPFFGNGTPFFTSNASGIPDSLNVYMSHQQQCFRFAISLGCNSTDGGYFDNVSLAFVDVPGVPGQASAGSASSIGGVSSDIWQFVQDSFPANEVVLPGSAAFDTAAALIRTGLNNAPATGVVARFDIPGDSSSAVAGNATGFTDANGNSIRVDLVFRILPGPGNYQTSTGITMNPHNATTGPAASVILRTRPDGLGVPVSANAASTNFWESYLGEPGAMSSAHLPGGSGHNGNQWDPTVWNSARMDTTEQNIFPVAGVTGTGRGGTTGNGWMTMYHEADPKFPTLGLNKAICFTKNTTLPPSSGPAPGVSNTDCSGTAALNAAYAAAAGYDGNRTTKEFTKIIPDGQLTPGSHVQYFYRKQRALDPVLSTPFAMCPDTNFITPQNNESSTDQHRWQQFAILPDRWKASGYGGLGAACMLYIDINDRRGNEGRFVSVMDSLGATIVEKRGAMNGWTAPGTTAISGLDTRTNASVRVSGKNSQPGTTWDMYNVKASESLTTSAGAPGGRFATPGTGDLGAPNSRDDKAGPTPRMLGTYYRMIALLSGDLNSGILGPFVNRSQDDIRLFDDFLTSLDPGYAARPRGMFVQGDGFGQAETQTAVNVPSHKDFMNNDLGIKFRNGVYQKLSGNQNDCADVLTTTSLTATADIYGVTNFCTFSNDVNDPNTSGRPETVVGATYENVGLVGPYVSDVVKPSIPARQWIAVTSGYEIEHLFSRYCETDNGRLAYYYYMLNKAFALMCPITGAASATLDTPQGNHGGYANFMKIGNSVMRQGQSTVRLSVAKAGRVQVTIYDVTGRKIKNLADRVFPAGEKSLIWDGTDDAGSKVARGVYFVRSSVAKDAGRIIVLNN